MYADKYPKVDAISEDLPFKFECSGRETVINVTRPAGGGSPRLIFWNHGAAQKFEPNTAHHLYQPAVDVLARKFAVARILFRDGQGQQPDWIERQDEVAEAVDRSWELGRFARGVLGVGGHSMGWDTSAGQRGIVYIPQVEAKRTFRNNSKIVVLVGWSPQGNDGRMDESSWSSLGCAMYGLTGLEDIGRQGDPYTWRWEPHQRATQIRRAMLTHKFDHDAGGAVRPTENGDQATVDAVCDYTMAAFCAHLLGDNEAHKALAHVDEYWGAPVVSDQSEYCKPGQESRL